MNAKEDIKGIENILSGMVKDFASWTYDELKKLIYKPLKNIKFRQKYAYAETWEVIDRLNEMTKFKWKNEVIELSVNDDEIDCLVRVSALIGGEWISKEQYGDLKRKKKSDGSNEFVNTLGKDKKGCVSDAIKKCASLFGIAHNLKEQNRK